jgi:hypothetical protein
MLPTQGLSPAQISNGQASLNALKVAETLTLTGTDFPVFGKVVVTAGVEKLGQSSDASAGSGSATGGKQASFTATMADSPTGSGVIGNPGIASIGVTTNPVGGGVVTGAAKTSAGGEFFLLLFCPNDNTDLYSLAAPTSSGTSKTTNTSAAKPATVTQSSALGLSIVNGFTVLAGTLAVILFL